MHNLKPKKYLGQHFLTNLEVASRIVHSLRAEAENTVVEIGPGEGVLTQFLVERFKHLLLLEVDQDAVVFLQQRFAKANIQLHQVDVLKWRIAEELTEEVSFIGNLPYNISSPIFFQLLEHRDKVKEGVFMVQKEVGQRICAKEGNKTYGILSVLLGAYFDLEYLFTVPPSDFRPPPKVDSGVIRMSRKSELPDIEFKVLKRVVKQAFNQRRKTLRNSLKSLDLPDFEGKEELLKLRAEQLSVEAFIRLAGMLA